jgi:alkylhydroperoxidase family enzyme
MVGLNDGEMESNRTGTSADLKTDTVLKLAQRLVLGKGRLTDTEISKARGAGLTDGEIEEVIANVALNVFTNYFNHVADPAIDFPQVIRTAKA